MSTFVEKLQLAAQRNNSLMCIGLDPDPRLMPIADVAEFNQAIVEATSDLVCAYKPNLGFYESLGPSGNEGKPTPELGVPGAAMLHLQESKFRSSLEMRTTQENTMLMLVACDQNGNK